MTDHLKSKCDCTFHLFKHKNCKDVCKCTPMTNKQFKIDVQRTMAQMDDLK